MARGRLAPVLNTIFHQCAISLVALSGFRTIIIRLATSIWCGADSQYKRQKDRQTEPRVNVRPTHGAKTNHAQEHMQTNKTRAFSSNFGKKAPGQNLEKNDRPNIKIGRNNAIEHNKGSKIHPQNQVILDCIMPSIPLKHKCLSIILIWVIVSHK